MKALIKLLLLTLSSLLLIACSDQSSDTAASNDHVWKEQTETINKAKEVEGMLMDSATNMQKAIENQE